MNRKRTFTSLIIIILITQFIVIQTTQNNSIFNNLVVSNARNDNDYSNAIITPDAPPGTEVIKSNVKENGGFEEAGSNGVPSTFTSYGTGYGSCNFSYPYEIWAGSHSSKFTAQGTKLNTGYCYGNRWVGGVSDAAVSENLTLDLYFNPKASPDYSQNGRMTLTLSFTRNWINYYYINYVFSQQSMSYGNSSNTVYYDTRGLTLDTWYHLERNITDDFVKGVTNLTALPTIFLYYFQIYVESPTDATGETILLMDEVGIINGTSYDYFALNGDFDQGNGAYWSGYSYGPANCEQTQIDVTEGISALNLSAYSPLTGFSSYQEVYTNLYVGWDTVPKGYVALQPGEEIIEFDWKYSDSGIASGSQMAFCYLTARNETDTTTLYYYLGTEDDLITQTNDTTAPDTRYRFAAPNMGTRDTWNHIYLDMYYVFEELNLENFILRDLGFYVESYNVENAYVQLLVDDFKLITYPTGDPGFEYDIGYDPSDTIRLWQTNTNANYANITTDAHTGLYAANVSSYSTPGLYYFSRVTYLPLKNNIFTDFWWRLDKLTSGGGAYANIRVMLDSTYSIYYVIGSRSVGFVNNSANCYYFVDNHNQTGSWYNIFRNITYDAISYFGNEDWNITYITINAYSDGSAETVAIFDDINFVIDAGAPNLVNIEHTPANPQYGEVVTVTCDASDNIGLESVTLNYKFNSDPYTPVDMTFNGMQYEAAIPAADYGTHVTYFILAIDVSGFTTSNDATPIEYIVDDFEPPDLLVEHPSELEILNETALFNITAEDLGSGIASFHIAIDGFTVYDELTVPSSYEWNTTSYINGLHSIVFTVYDNAGNDYWVGYGYDIYNEPEPTPTPTPTDVGALFSGLMSFGLVVGVATTVIYLSERRKKYLK